MEVDLRPPMSGCMMVFIAVATFGVYPLLRRMIEMRFVIRMDDDGFVTKAGTRVRWAEIIRITHVSREMDGRMMSDEYDIRSPQGRSYLALSRTGNVREVLDYFIQRVPQAAWTGD